MSHDYEVTRPPGPHTNVASCCSVASCCAACCGLCGLQLSLCEQLHSHKGYWTRACTRRLFAFYIALFASLHSLSSKWMNLIDIRLGNVLICCFLCCACFMHLLRSAFYGCFKMRDNLHWTFLTVTLWFAVQEGEQVIQRSSVSYYCTLQVSSTV